MKKLLTLILSFSLLYGCSTSEQATEERVKIEPTIKITDTTNVNVSNYDKPFYEPKTKPPNTPTHFTPTFPKGKYSVQIGAYNMPENANRIAELAKERFNISIYTIYDPENQLYKVLIGDFDTKESARSFRDEITFKYSDDYKDAWVSENPQK